MARPRLPGRVFYLGRLRYRPDLHPPELLEVLEAIEAAEPERRAEIVAAALIGGAGPATAVASREEDADAIETEKLLSDLFG